MSFDQIVLTLLAEDFKFLRKDSDSRLTYLKNKNLLVVIENNSIINAPIISLWDEKKESLV